MRLQEMLNKTIVFITHDFDEALRLADRIAIMKDGAVEQCDTPDQIVLHPATEYVRKFTEDIDKARVVHAGVLAQPDMTGEGDPVDARATVHDMARLLVNDTREMIPVQTRRQLIGAMAPEGCAGYASGDRRMTAEPQYCLLDQDSSADADRGWVGLHSRSLLTILQYSGLLARWLHRLPEAMIPPFCRLAGRDFQLCQRRSWPADFDPLPDGRAGMASGFTANLLFGKRRWPNIGPIPWTAMAAVAAVIGYYLGGWRSPFWAAVHSFGPR